MSKRHKEYTPYEGYGYPNICMIIILILIVLQWYRVGCYSGVAGVPGGAGIPGPEPGLMANGGLFIITLFILIACCCCKPMEQKYRKCGHKH